MGGSCDPLGWQLDCLGVLFELLPEGWRVLRNPLCRQHGCYLAFGMLQGCILGPILTNGVPQGGALIPFLNFFDWVQADGSLVAITAERAAEEVDPNEMP